MELQPGQVLELLDFRELALGRMTLEGRAGELLLGRFTPGPNYAAVESLFQDFEDAANAQALGTADKCEDVIAAVGLRLRMMGGNHVGVKDVQIWSDGGITCRLTDAVSGPPMADRPVTESGERAARP